MPRTSNTVPRDPASGRGAGRARPVRRPSRLRLVALLAIPVALLAAGGAYFAVKHRSSGDTWTPPELSYAELTGSVFLRAPPDPLRVPAVRELRLPPIERASSVWGATGRDPRGRIWVGVSSRSSLVGARLLEYEPDGDRWHDRGGVLDQLKSAGVYRDGESQTKIHSKIATGQDGRLYFASSDEDGEVPGTVLPRWGGHLWRIDLDTFKWEHLAAVPEALVAVAGASRYIYALGYWDHVLYRFDIVTGELRRTVVGAAAGHMSRNFLVDAKGHVYVPRVQAGQNGKFSAALVEYDGELTPVRTTPLEFYLSSQGPGANHGIVGIAYLPDGRMAFTTHRGQLYLIEPQNAGPAKVTALGWFHPRGEGYVPSLFALGGTFLAGVARQTGGFEWVVFELKTRHSVSFPLDTKGLEKVLLYGSISRDNAGRFYLGGWASDGAGGQRPLVLRLSAAPE